MAIDHGNPPQDFIRDHAEGVVQCKSCGYYASASNNDCACNVQCCEMCGSACVRFVGEFERWCTVCDAQLLADFAVDPDCGPLETHAQAQRRVLKIEAAERPAFTGTWIGRVLNATADCSFDGECLAHPAAEEPTTKTRIPSMAELVGGGR